MPRPQISIPRKPAYVGRSPASPVITIRETTLITRGTQRQVLLRSPCFVTPAPGIASARCNPGDFPKEQFVAAD